MKKLQSNFTTPKQSKRDIINSIRDAYCKEFQTEELRYVAKLAFDMGVDVAENQYEINIGNIE